MARFKIGDHLATSSGSHHGKLIDIDGTTGYLEQANGVEIEFPLQQLKVFEAEPTRNEPATVGPGGLRERRLTPEQAALLASVPPAVMQAVARNYDRGQPPAPFDTLSDLRKLSVVKIYLPQVDHALLVDNMKLVVAMRALSR